MFADGCILIEKNGANRIQLVIHPKDEILFENFVRFINVKESIKEIKRDLIYVRVRSNKIVNDLILYGCVPRKSNIIELPELDYRELYLAFLLGYYDGDGTVNTTRISTGSKKFLEQIKEKFNLSFKIRLDERDGLIEKNRIIHTKKYVLCLGAELFNEMMDNYKESLPRKRKYFCMNDERIERIKDNAWKGSHKKKLNMTKEELKKLVWELPSTKIAERYGVSDSLITKRCRQFGIEKPPRGYWAKHRSISKNINY